jgi:hypothetical protein
LLAGPRPAPTLRGEFREPGPDDFASSWHGSTGSISSPKSSASPNPPRRLEGTLRGYRLEGSPTFQTAAEAMAAIDLVS